MNWKVDSGLIPANGLTAFEGQVAMMRAAGASHQAIAMILESSQEVVTQSLQKPRVANRVLMLQASMGTALAPALKDVSDAIENAAERAFAIEIENMEGLHGMATNAFVPLKPGDEIKARVSASMIAQDILDRAGKRAPTRVINASVNVPAEALGHLTDVMKEMGEAIDVTDR